MDKVELFSSSLAGEVREFDFKKAEAVLLDASTRKVPTWELSEKSKKTYDFVNGKLIIRPNKGKNKKTGTKSGD